MSIEMKPGRWRQRDGRIAIVLSGQQLDHWPWRGVDADDKANSWQNDGSCLTLHHVDDLDLIEYLGPPEGKAVSEKHEAAKRLLQAAEQMQASLTEETDGEGICSHARVSVLHAKVIELLTRPETQDPEDDDEDEIDEGMFDPEDDT